MNLIFDSNGHLTSKAVTLIKSGDLSEVEMIRVLDHITSCEICAGALSESYDENELLEVPAGFANEVESRISHKKTNKKEFVFYSMRVACAACAALAILAFYPVRFINSIDAETSGIKAPDTRVVDSINRNLEGFSEKLLYMEVFHNEKKKK